MYYYILQLMRSLIGRNFNHSFKNLICGTFKKKGNKRLELRQMQRFQPLGGLYFWWYSRRKVEKDYEYLTSKGKT